MRPSKLGRLLGTQPKKDKQKNLAARLAHEHARGQGKKHDAGIYETIVDDSTVNATVHVPAAQSPHRLVYKTPQLTSPVHLSGLPTLELNLKFSKAAAIVSAMIVQYNANGTQTIISRGWADPQNRHSIWDTYALEPGQPYELELECQPHDHVFPAGSRIGLVLIGGDWKGSRRLCSRCAHLRVPRSRSTRSRALSACPSSVVSRRLPLRWPRNKEHRPCTHHGSADSR